MINARSETVATKPAFRSAFKKRRCLVIADGFYEWKKVEKEKQPYYISRCDDQPIVMAGLWESWNDKSNPDQEAIETCTIITTEANATMASLHDRMPVILSKDQFDFWLDTGFSDAAELEKLLVPSPAEELQTYPVDKRVGKPVNDDQDCIKEVDPDAPEKGHLF